MNTLQSSRPDMPREQIEPARRPTPPAKGPAAEVDDPVLALIPALAGTLAGIVVLAGIAFALLGQAGGIAALSAALIGPHSAWYLSRASAFVAYVLLWWSMLLGLAITNRMARAWPGGPTAADLHEHASLLGLGFGLLHGLVLLGDKYIGYTLPQILIPFAGAAYRPLWVGLGQIGLYLMALVTFSFYVRRWIGARAWRLIHFLSFAVFALALFHGVASGTDSGAPWVARMYLGSAVSVVALTIYRVIVRRRACSWASRPRKAQ